MATALNRKDADMLNTVLTAAGDVAALAAALFAFLALRQVLPTSLFDHPTAELLGDDSAGLCGHRAPPRTSRRAADGHLPSLPAVMRSCQPGNR